MSKNRKRHGGSTRGDLIQAIQPSPVRISPPLRDPELVKIARQIEDLKAAWARKSPDADRLLAPHQQALQQYEQILQRQMGMLADVCTGLWRIKQNFSQIPMEEMPDKVRRSNRHLDAIMDTLNQGGISIKDHLHEAYDPGMFLNVAAFEPTDGISRDTIIETIKPSVYWEDRCIQSGEVIVGSPKRAEESA